MITEYMVNVPRYIGTNVMTDKGVVVLPSKSGHLVMVYPGRGENNFGTHARHLFMGMLRRRMDESAVVLLANDFAWRESQELPRYSNIDPADLGSVIRYFMSTEKEWERLGGPHGIIQSTEFVGFGEGGGVVAAFGCLNLGNLKKVVLVEPVADGNEDAIVKSFAGFTGTVELYRTKRPTSGFDFTTIGAEHPALNFQVFENLREFPTWIRVGMGLSRVRLLDAPA